MRRLQLPYNERLNSLLEERDDLSVQISMAENQSSVEISAKFRRLHELDEAVRKEWGNPKCLSPGLSAPMA